MKAAASVDRCQRHWIVKSWRELKIRTITMRTIQVSRTQIYERLFVCHRFSFFLWRDFITCDIRSLDAVVLNLSSASGGQWCCLKAHLNGHFVLNEWNDTANYLCVACVTSSRWRLRTEIFEAAKINGYKAWEIIKFLNYSQFIWTRQMQLNSINCVIKCKERKNRVECKNLSRWRRRRCR